jgi:phosphoglycerate dehydrogenase-like enzyme
MIGVGAAGRHLIKLLTPFDVEIMIYDPYINKNDFANNRSLLFGTLNDVLEFGNILTIQASLTPETSGMIGKDELSIIKDNAIIINTARSKIINEGALADELIKGRLSAVLDVFDIEPLPINSPLRGLQNVILTPHIAGRAGAVKWSEVVIDEIERFIAGKPLKYEISKERYNLMTRAV